MRLTSLGARYLIATLVFAVEAGANSRSGQYIEDPSYLPVKVVSYFSRGSDQKLEGSGFLFQNEGKVWVLTSEHVVIPDKDVAVHEIQTLRGEKMEATFEKASWSRGLALLSVKMPHRSISARGLPSAEAYRGRGAGAAGGYSTHMIAYGFPAGSTTLASRVGPNLRVEIAPRGTVLAGQEVMSVAGLRAEFGMSGGPVVTSNSLLGVLTHVTYEERSRTFAIPIWAAMEWVFAVGPEEFQRTYEDVQAQWLARDGAESVLHRGMGLRLEKRGTDLLVHRISDDPRYMYDVRFDSALYALRQKMTRERLRIAKITAVVGRDRTRTALGPSTTLSQFVGLMSQQETTAEIQDFESTSEDPSLGLTRIPSFFPRDTILVDDIQRAVYAVRSIRHERRNQLDSMGRLGVGLVPVEIRGTLVYETYTVEPSEIITRVQYEGEFAPRTDRIRPTYLASMDWWRTTLANCEADGGVVEIIEVKAGRYRTCRKLENGRKIWYGPVPVRGIVKMEATSGAFAAELQGVRY